MNKQTSECELEMLDKLDHFVKCIVLKIGLGESKVVAERNFDCPDESGILEFNKEYRGRHNNVVLRVEM